MKEVTMEEKNSILDEMNLDKALRLAKKKENAKEIKEANPPKYEKIYEDELSKEISNEEINITTIGISIISIVVFTFILYKFILT